MSSGTYIMIFNGKDSKLIQISAQIKVKQSVSLNKDLAKEQTQEYIPSPPKLSSLKTP